MKPEAQRTSTQNRSIHLFFDHMSKALKENGVTFSSFLEALQTERKVEMFWSPHLVKQVWKAVQKEYTGKDSTAELTKTEVNEVYEIVNKAFAEIAQTTVPFPSIETLIE